MLKQSVIKELYVIMIGELIYFPQIYKVKKNLCSAEVKEP